MYAIFGVVGKVYTVAGTVEENFMPDRILVVFAVKFSHKYSDFCRQPRTGRPAGRTATDSLW
jgi:hypothetical protein